MKYPTLLDGVGAGGLVRRPSLLVAAMLLVPVAPRALVSQATEATLDVRRVTFVSPRSGRALPPGGIGEVTVSIANTGAARITQATAEFTVGSGMRIVEHSSIGPRYLRSQRVELGDLPPGAARDIRVTVTAERRAAASGVREVWMLLSAPELPEQVPFDRAWLRQPRFQPPHRR